MQTLKFLKKSNSILKITSRSGGEIAVGHCAIVLHNHRFIDRRGDLLQNSGGKYA